MDLKEIKEQLVDKLKEYGQKVADNDTVIQLVERYKALSPLVQKVITVLTITLVLYVIYSVPASYVASSVEYEESFINNRNLIRGLFRSARQPIINADKFSGLTTDQLKSRVDGLLAGELVVDSQKGPSYPSKATLSGQIPAAIKQEGMTFEIKKLNLKQIVNLSERISTMHPNTKLAALEIFADEKDPHYYNVKYSVSSLSLPIKSEGKPAIDKKKQ